MVKEDQKSEIVAALNKKINPDIQMKILYSICHENLVAKDYFSVLFISWEEKE